MVMDGGAGPADAHFIGCDRHKSDTRSPRGVKRRFFAGAPSAGNEVVPFKAAGLCSFLLRTRERRAGFFAKKRCVGARGGGRLLAAGCWHNY